jgi:hypothetical protein
VRTGEEWVPDRNQQLTNLLVNTAIVQCFVFFFAVISNSAKSALEVSRIRNKKKGYAGLLHNSHSNFTPKVLDI